MKKKILHMISQYPERTGSGVYFRAIIKELAKQGYAQSVLYAVNSGDGIELKEFELEKEYIVEFDTEKMPFKIPGMSDAMPYESVKYSDMTEEMLELWKKGFKEILERAVAEYQPDIILTHHLWLMTALTAELDLNITTIAFCHGTDIRQFKKGCSYREYIAQNCRKLCGIFALSNKQKAEIAKLYGIQEEKIEAIGGGFDSGKFHLPVKKERRDKLRLVYVGKLSYSKGVGSLVRVYERLDEDVELILVGSGDGEEGESVLEEIRRCGKDIKLMGHISQRELGDVFRSSDLFVLPSFYEGLSLVSIEALASGLRVVVSATGGISEYLGDAINSSGLIEYVELPSMENVDEPVKQELEDFERRFLSAVKRQISRIKEKENIAEFKELYPTILEKSWGEVAAKVDGKIKSFEFKG